MSFEHVIGLGVAGNFAGHLEQAGEASDFRDLEIADPRAPKGVFPFYIPVPASGVGVAEGGPERASAKGDADHFLNVYPVSASEIRLGSREEKHQIEPEVSLLCDLAYEEPGSAMRRVRSISPRQAMAHNDCSIRREGAKKISEKKNWGACTKGTSSQSVPIDRFSKGGVLDDYRIASFLKRGAALHAYGVDSAVSSYSYMYEQLLEWLVTRLNDQIDEGPLENISQWIQRAGYPEQALISIGATRYTDFGESNFLEPGDESIVAVYDSNRFTPDEIEAIARAERAVPDSGISLLRQIVTGS